MAELHNAGCSDEQVARLLEFITIQGENDEILRKLETIDINNEQFQTGARELHDVLTGLTVACTRLCRQAAAKPAGVFRPIPMKMYPT